MRGADIYTGRREKRVKKGVRTLFGNAKRWFSLARLEKRILTPFFTSFARHFSLSRYIGMVWLLVLTLVSLPDGAPDRTELDAQFAEQLESLASKCDELKLPELAQATRTWRVSAPGDRNLLYIAPEADPLAIDESATELTKSWHARLTALRQAQAEGLASEDIIARLLAEVPEPKIAKYE
jgi:hypothetical protein